jgi:DNA-binding HxlR family transcriptional regulator
MATRTAPRSTARAAGASRTPARRREPAPDFTPPPEVMKTEANCRAREMIIRIADKWSMYVIHVLSASGPVRFNDLRRRVEGVSQRMLTVTLRGLERDGLVARTMYPEVPPRVEYTLTPLGTTLRDIVDAAMAWSGAHLHEVDEARARYDARVQAFSD